MLQTRILEKVLATKQCLKTFIYSRKDSQILVHSSVSPILWRFQEHTLKRHTRWRYLILLYCFKLKFFFNTTLLHSIRVLTSSYARQTLCRQRCTSRSHDPALIGPFAAEHFGALLRPDCVVQSAGAMNSLLSISL